MNKFETFLNSKAGRKIPRVQWADRFEVSPSFVAHLVSGVRMPGLATAYRIEVMTNGQVPMQSWIEEADGGSLPLTGAEPATAP